MSLLTRCTHCHTTFRVVPEQLQAQGGQVRCGRCFTVFNALTALVSEVVSGSGNTIPPTRSALFTGTPAGTADPAPIDSPQTLPPMQNEAPAGASLSATPAARRSPPAVAPTNPGTRTAAKAATPAFAAVDTTDNPFVHELSPAPPVRRPWLTAACLLLLGVLAAQAVYFYRGEVAGQHALLRQWLSESCVLLGCTIQLPPRPKVIAIEASDLQILDPARPSRIQLTATLRNHSNNDVAYPALDLVLTNANEHTLARRIFLPMEYLGPRLGVHAGLAANAELTVRLGLDTGDLGAAGFRLAVLAAPSP